MITRFGENVRLKTASMLYINTEKQDYISYKMMYKVGRF